MAKNKCRSCERPIRLPSRAKGGRCRHCNKLIRHTFIQMSAISTTSKSTTRPLHELQEEKVYEVLQDPKVSEVVVTSHGLGITRKDVYTEV